MARRWRIRSPSLSSQKVSRSSETSFCVLAFEWYFIYSRGIGVLWHMVLFDDDERSLFYLFWKHRRFVLSSFPPHFLAQSNKFGTSKHMVIIYLTQNRKINVFRKLISQRINGDYLCCGLLFSRRGIADRKRVNRLFSLLIKRYIPSFFSPLFL